MKRINQKAIAIGNGNIVFRNVEGQSTVEFHSASGDIFQMEQDKAESLIETAGEFGRMGRRANGKAQTTARKTPVTTQTDVEVPASAASVPKKSTTKKAKQGTRYSVDDQRKFAEGYVAAENKAEFCRMNSVGVDSVKRWVKKHIQA
jgi:hypothetical protein